MAADGDGRTGALSPPPTAPAPKPLDPAGRPLPDPPEATTPGIPPVIGNAPTGG